MKKCKHPNEFYTCKRYRLLVYLMERGFQPCETLPDPKNPKYCLWTFKNCPELEECLDEYFAALKK